MGIAVINILRVKWEQVKIAQGLPLTLHSKGGKIGFKIVEYTGMEQMELLDIP